MIEFWSQERVDEMVAAVGWQLYQKSHAEACARLAADETKMGVYEHKLPKHQKKTLGVLRDLHGLKTVGVIETNEAKGLIKIAKPIGVIGALNASNKRLLNTSFQWCSDFKNTKCGNFRSTPKSKGNM